MRFKKMHGLGNDFIVTEALPTGLGISLGEFARRICDRHHGVGADGLVIVGPSQRADCRMTIINSDGREAESCGNALRCVAHFAHRSQYSPGPVVSIETLSGVQLAHIISSDEQGSMVSVDMGHPLLSPKDFPATLDSPGPILGQSVTTPYGTYDVSLVRVGVPHIVIFVENLSAVDIVGEGRALEEHPIFPAGANVNFVLQKDENRFVVRVWERGAGATMACGTGACAVAVAAILHGRAANDVVVDLPGGQLEISWKPGRSITMFGPAVEVFSGEYQWRP
jgi:diaminopimelate epimerase